VLRRPLRIDTTSDFGFPPFSFDLAEGQGDDQLTESFSSTGDQTSWDVANDYGIQAVGGLLPSSSPVFCIVSVLGGGTTDTLLSFCRSLAFCQNDNMAF
jgi:hypothetical protein